MTIIRCIKREIPGKNQRGLAQRHNAPIFFGRSLLHYSNELYRFFSAGDQFAWFCIRQFCGWERRISGNRTYRCPHYCVPSGIGNEASALNLLEPVRNFVELPSFQMIFLKVGLDLIHNQIWSFCFQLQLTCNPYRRLTIYFRNLE